MKEFSTQRLSLFPTSTYLSDNVLTLEELSDIERYILADYKEKKPEIISEKFMHELKEWKPLVDVVNVMVDKYLGDHEVKCKDYKIMNMWYNVFKKGEWYNKHNHTQAASDSVENAVGQQSLGALQLLDDPDRKKIALISGIFYVDGDNEGTEFYDPRPATTLFNPKVEKENGLNSTKVIFPFVRNRIILFPSYLEHSVPKSTSDKDRITVSFNVNLV